IRVIGIDHVLAGDELVEVISHADVVVDGTDNFDARFEINRACVAARRPLVTGAVVRYEGQVSVFRLDHADSPCYACLYASIQEPPRNCSQNGVLGSVAGIVGCIQATEVIKVLLGIGKPLTGRLLLVDALNMEWHTVGLRKDPKCEVCGAGN
ncbi:MAG: ThiF family adenylyltransferase, partial [Saprospiraceae bacterium]|nr:ThiF family adenylyltransferase [Saprospiraceae bacterium]